MDETADRHDDEIGVDGFNLSLVFELGGHLEATIEGAGTVFKKLGFWAHGPRTRVS